MSIKTRNSQYDVFISYAQADAEWARLLGEALSAHGVRVFSDFSEASFHPGENFRRKFEQALQESEYVVVVVSEGSANSSWVAFELGAALGMGKEVVPIISKGVRNEDLSGPIKLRKSLEKNEPEIVAQQLLTKFSKKQTRQHNQGGAY